MTTIKSDTFVRDTDVWFSGREKRTLRVERVSSRNVFPLRFRRFSTINVDEREGQRGPRFHVSPFRRSGSDPSWTDSNWNVWLKDLLTPNKVKLHIDELMRDHAKGRIDTNDTEYHSRLTSRTLRDIPVVTPHNTTNYIYVLVRRAPYHVWVWTDTLACRTMCESGRTLPNRKSIRRKYVGGLFSVVTPE